MKGNMDSSPINACKGKKKFHHISEGSCRQMPDGMESLKFLNSSSHKSVSMQGLFPSHTELCSGGSIVPALFEILSGSVARLLSLWVLYSLYRNLLN